MIGKVVREFLPKADLLPYLEAILHVYNLSGRRDNKYKARLKILVHEETLEVVRERVEAAFVANKAHDAAGEPGAGRRDRGGLRAAGLRGAGAAAAAARRRAARLGRHQRRARTSSTHYAIVTVSLKPIGGTPGDATAEQMRVVADLAEEYGHDEMRVSHEQNLILPHVPRRHLPEVYARLKAAGLATANVGLISDIIACPGMDYCALATARSIPVAQEIAEAFADLDRQRDIGPLKIKISGCINACGHHHVGHIGILGLDRAGVENYQITLGGDGTETAAIGEKAGHGFAYDEVVPAVERLIEAYLDLRLEPGESFLAGLPPARHRAVQGGALPARRRGPMRLEPGALRAPPLDRVEALRLAYGDAAGRRTCWPACWPSSPTRWRWSRPSGRRRRCCCKMVADVDRDLPVLMIDSLMLFEETLEYQRTLSRTSGLTNVQAPAAGPDADLARLDPDDTLHQRDTDACCEIRKVLPLDRALRRWPVTITGRKRFQASTRAALEVFEADGRAAEGQPAGALVGGGSARLHGRARPAAASAGGAGASGRSAAGPAPRRSAEGEDERAGRWRGSDKVECGIHFGADGRILRAAS